MNAGDEREIAEYITAVCNSFRGEISQIPPMYSAVWSNGKRLYDLARQGIEVERQPRNIFIRELEVQDISFPLVTIRVVCSKGTYIRTLCEDIGDQLGTGAAMEKLTRTRVGNFRLEDAMTLGQIQEIMNAGEPVTNDRDGKPIGNNIAGMQEHIIPIDAFFADAPSVHVRSDCYKFLRNGNPLSGENVVEGRIPHTDKVRVYDEDGIFWALYHYEPQRRRILPVRMFHVTDSIQ